MNLDIHQYLEELKNHLKTAIKKVNFDLYSVNKRTTLPAVVISIENFSEAEQTVDSSRELKYCDVSISFEVFTKDEQDFSKEEKCNKIVNLIINSLKNENYRNLFLSNSRPLPNLDSNVFRWRMVYTATINTNNNGII
jgi:hypothetical protein